MKLYLSSIGIPNKEAYKSLFKDSPATIGIIPNAWIPYPQQKSLPYIESLTHQLEEMGFNTKQIDLLDYTGRQNKLHELLRELQGVWVTGGNTFYLNWSMHQSGFQNIIHELCRNGLIYGGESAGAVIAGTTLRGIENLDNPQDAPQIIWDGLNLVDFGIVPHWGNEKYFGKLEACKLTMANETTVKILDDNQYVLVDE